MNIYIIIVIIALISFAWALLSFVEQNKKSKIIKNVKKELSRGRVIFQKKN